MKRFFESIGVFLILLGMIYVLSEMGSCSKLNMGSYNSKPMIEIAPAISLQSPPGVGR